MNGRNLLAIQPILFLVAEIWLSAIFKSYPKSVVAACLAISIGYLIAFDFALFAA